MKILAIRGKNLASLEQEFVIDFTTEPLKSAGIFAITGNTGAGKSTILDALCLALFDETPRAYKAGENIQITDVQDRTINQKDSRNILRRGSSEGYAETDFIALNGDRYRSRWMVRRARGKADAPLQNTEIRLENLTSSIEEPGTKRELLQRITGLIGLTFDQFTRAVLLAQGDFATFLKAKQQEKAELLEKITGTAIYSRISSLIYRNTKEAEQALEIIRQKINDMNLLPEEEVISLVNRKRELEQEQSGLKDRMISIEKKTAWIKQEEELRSHILRAEEQLTQTKKIISESHPRFKYIEQWTKVQEIQPVYADMLNHRKQQQNIRERLAEQQLLLKNILQNIEEQDKELGSVKTMLDEINSRYESLKPDIDKARECDIHIISAGERVTEAEKELALQTEIRRQSEKNIELIRKQESETGEKRELLSKWFADREVYRDMIPHIDLIISFLDDAKHTREQQIKASESLNGNIALLQTLENKLDLLENEAERLNQILPGEIVHWREKLENGKPCPVCGSLHHPVLQENEHISKVNIDEGELEKSKKKIAEEILLCKQKNEITRLEIIQLETLIQNYKSQHENAIKKAGEFLRHIPQWEDQVLNGVIRKKLTDLSLEWNRNREICDTHIQLLENLKIKKEAEEKKFRESDIEFNRRKILLDNYKVSLNSLLEKRQLLLKGRKVEDIESNYQRQKQTYTNQYEELRLGKEKTEIQKSGITGIISQLNHDLGECDRQMVILDKQVDIWMNNHEKEMTPEKLHELATKSREWISQETEFLNGLREQELTLTTTLKERNSRLENHHQLPDKPSGEENRELLTEEYNELLEQDKIVKHEITSIEIRLATQEAGKKQVQVYEKEFSEKQQLCESWQKLNHLLGSADGGKFKTIAQGYTLDILLGYANQHLERLTKRYELEKIPGTLALQVIDHDMLDEARTVHSLSGGESFLVSLSLALGLSSLSSNRMKIESLFIDEGFGSLDADTLGIAMDALENLQTQGRKIGVISHVSEMTERIPTQIRVVKLANGKSKVEIA